jgi:hypothetical protein
MERAIALDPLAPGVRVGFMLVALAARRHDVVDREARRAATLEPSLLGVRRYYQVLSALVSGTADRCAMLSLGLDIGVRAMCLNALRRFPDAARMADSLRAIFTRGKASDSITPGRAARRLAEYYAWSGNAPESLAWLERAYGLSPTGELFEIIDSGLYDKVRNDPRFQAGLQRIRTRIYQRTQRARRGAELK